MRYCKATFLPIGSVKGVPPTNSTVWGRRKTALERGRAPRFGTIDAGPIRGSSRETGSKFFEMNC